MNYLNNNGVINMSCSTKLNSVITTTKANSNSIETNIKLLNKYCDANNMVLVIKIENTLYDVQLLKDNKCIFLINSFNLTGALNILLDDLTK